MRFMTLRKTGRTTVPETPVEFVDGLSRRIKSVDDVKLAGQRSHLTPLCACRMGVEMKWASQGQPFEGRWQLIDMSTPPPEVCRRWCWLEGSWSIGTDCKPTQSSSDRRD